MNYQIDSMVTITGAEYEAMRAEIANLRAAVALKADAEETCLRAVDHVGQHNSGARITEAKGWVRAAFSDIDEDELSRAALTKENET